jgi:hypothetical protein
MNVSGVCPLWGTNDGQQSVCLTAGQTVNLGKELTWTLRVLSNGHLKALERENPGCTGGWYRIQKCQNLRYMIIAQDMESFQQRELIEAAYAVKNEAIYWNPSPTQLHLKFL